MTIPIDRKASDVGDTLLCGYPKLPNTCQSRRPQSPGPLHAVTLFNIVLVPHVPVQGRHRAARHPLPLPYPHCGVVPWVTDSITPLANPPSRSMQSDNICVTHVSCRATGVPAAAFSPIPRPSQSVLPSCFPADYSCWSLRPS